MALTTAAVVAFAALVFMQTTAILLFKLCQEEGKYTFSPASSIAISEATKLALASTFHYRAVGKKKFFEGLTPSIVHAIANYAGLAFLYTVNNYITFHVHLVADPGTYTLGKSVTPYLVAVMLRILGDRLHELQWLCVIIQCCGIAITQYAIIAFSACITATCGVWNQKVVKGFNVPVNLQNAVLYSFGFVLALIAYVAPSESSEPRIGFFYGYGALSMALICFQAFQGLYADAIVKNFAGAAVMAILVILSTFLFDFHATATTWLGVIVVLCTTYTYMKIAVKLPRPRPEEEDVEADVEAAKALVPS